MSPHDNECSATLHEKGQVRKPGLADLASQVSIFVHLVHMTLVALQAGPALEPIDLPREVYDTLPGPVRALRIACQSPNS